MLRFFQKILLVLLLFTSYVTCISQLDPPTLLQSLQQKGGEIPTTNIILSMTKARSVDEVFENSPKSIFQDRNLRLNHVAQKLRAEANKVQLDVLDFLKSEVNQSKAGMTPKMSFEQMWITNQIIVEGADSTLIQKLVERSDISIIQEEKFYTLLDVPVENPGTFEDEDEAWGINNIEVAKVWEEGIRGEGVFIASIDSGVVPGHEALYPNYRMYWGWYDPVGNAFTAVDNVGIGSHTMGTAVGKSGENVGVAPDAKFISCKACSPVEQGGTEGPGRTCSSINLMKCSQWVLCPFDLYGYPQDCTKAPNVVLSAVGDTAVDVAPAFVKAGIIGVFPVGDHGPRCRSTGGTMTDIEGITVGSITEQNEVSDFSSRGPFVPDNGFKPDLVAPGSATYAIGTESTTQYVYKSGTITAAAHVAGIVALILSKYPGLDYYQVKDLLVRGAVPDTVPQEQACGGVFDSMYPNHVVGAGRANAYNSVVVLKPRDPEAETTTDHLVETTTDDDWEGTTDAEGTTDGEPVPTTPAGANHVFYSNTVMIIMASVVLFSVKFFDKL